jgi:cytoskeletal protein CcmA (bactofilin family)
MVDGAVWAGGEARVDRNGVVEGPIVSQKRIDWQGKRAQSLVAPHVRLGRSALPLDLKGSILCQILALEGDACISGTLGSLVVTKDIVRQDDRQAIRSLFVLAGTIAEGIDVPCAVTLDDRVRLGQLYARGNVVLGEGCEVESASGANVVVGANCTVSHVYARGTLVLGPGSTVRTAIAQGRITVDATARVEGDLIASASGEVEIGGSGWFADPRRQYRANVAALLDPEAKGGPLQGWAAVRYLPHSLYRQLEGLLGGWYAALQPVADSSPDQGRVDLSAESSSMGEPA